MFWSYFLIFKRYTVGSCYLGDRRKWVEERHKVWYLLFLFSCLFLNNVWIKFYLVLIRLQKLIRWFMALLFQYDILFNEVSHMFCFFIKHSFQKGFNPLILMLLLRKSIQNLKLIFSPLHFRQKIHQDKRVIHKSLFLTNRFKNKILD